MIRAAIFLATTALGLLAAALILPDFQLSLVGGGLAITGIGTWILGTLIVWIVTALGAWLLPLIALKKRDA